MMRAESPRPGRLAHPATPDQGQSAAAQATDGHRGVHSEAGALRGEHPGRSRNPVIKVAGLAWLEFEKPDLEASRAIRARLRVRRRRPHPADAGAARHVRPGRVHGGPRPAPRARFVGPAFQAAAQVTWTGWPAAPRDGVSSRTGGGTPSRCGTRAGSRCASCTASRTPALPERHRCALNFGTEPRAGQRHAAARPAAGRDPAAGPRGAGDDPRSAPPWTGTWTHLGLIVSDFLYLDGQRDRGPAMAFIRCDRGSEPGRPPHPGDGACSRRPATCTRPTRSPTSTRSPPAGSTCASTATGTRGASAGTSRAARSSTTGATRTASCSSTSPTATCSTATLEPGWAPLSVSGLAQWGPKATREFTGAAARAAGPAG